MHLAPFVSRTLVEVVMADPQGHFAAFDSIKPQDLATASANLPPVMHEMEAAVMIADVKGFTQLTEILSKKGSSGVELLTNCMNNYFTKVINMILAFDGDVVKFAGDSMIVLFMPSVLERETADKGLLAASQRCARCAHMLATLLGRMRMKMNGQVEPFVPVAQAAAPPAAPAVTAPLDPAPEEAEEPAPPDSTGPAGATGQRKLVQSSSNKKRTSVGSQSSSAAVGTDARTLQAVQHASQQLVGSLQRRESLSSGQLANSPEASPTSIMRRGSPGLGSSGRFVNFSDLPGESPERTTLQDPSGAPEAGGSATADNNDAAGGKPPGAEASASRSTVKNLLTNLLKGSKAAGADDGPGRSGSVGSGPTRQASAIDSRMASPGTPQGGGSGGSGGSPGTAAAPLVRTRARARTELPAALGVGMQRLLGGAGGAGSDSSASSSTMWGPEGSPGINMVRREMSLATKLNIPPPVRMLGNANRAPGGDRPIGPAAMKNSFTNQTGSFALVPGMDGLGSPGGPMGTSTRLANVTSPPNWAATLSQQLQKVVMTGPGADAPLTNAGSSAQQAAMMGDGAIVVGDGGSASQARDSMDAQDDELEGVGQSGTSPRPGSRGQYSNLGNLGSPDGPPSPLPKAVAQAKTTGDAYIEWSEDSYEVTASPMHIQYMQKNRPQQSRSVSKIGGFGTTSNTPGGSGVGGPIAEGVEEAGPSRQSSGPVGKGKVVRRMSFAWVADALMTKRSGGEATSSPTNTEDSEGRLGAKVLNWMRRASQHELGRPNDLTRLGEEREEAEADGGEGAAAPRAMYQPPAVPNKPRGDTIMEEACNSEFSLKVIISAGTVCGFQVGGLVDEVPDPNAPEVPRWEFFIGDRPLAPKRDAAGRRRCIAQLAAVEDLADSGTVVGSREILDLLDDTWDYDLVREDAGQLMSSFEPFQIPGRGARVGTLIQQRGRRSLAALEGQDGSTPERQDTGGDSVADSGLGGCSASGPLPRLRNVTRSDSVHAGLEGRPVSQAGTGEPLPVVENAPLGAPELATLPENLQHRLAAVLRMHLPGAVCARVEAGHLDFINELRPLTCLFVGFPTLLDPKDTATDSDQLNAVQACMRATQAAMRKWDGSLLQFRCDEKGYLAICAFGLPGHTHEDNPSRGVLAALDLHRMVADVGHRAAIGVTTGDLLCTCVGARKLRTEYTVFGDAINLSARLMVKCKSGAVKADILCDEFTYGHAKFKAAYEEMQPLPVKGRKLPVMVFRVAPFGAKDGQSGGERSAAAAAQAAEATAGAARNSMGVPERPLVGRLAETSFILDRATKLITGKAQGGAVIIEGNTGMGKTKLLQEVRHTLEHMQHDLGANGLPHFHIFSGSADIANKTTKLHPWRRIFQEMFAVDRNNGSHNEPVTRRGSMIAPKGTGDPACSAGFALRRTPTALGTELARVFPLCDPDWIQQVAELLDIPVESIPVGRSPSPEQDASLAGPTAGPQHDAGALESPRSSGGGQGAGASLLRSGSPMLPMLPMHAASPTVSQAMPALTAGPPSLQHPAAVSALQSRLLATSAPAPEGAVPGHDSGGDAADVNSSSNAGATRSSSMRNSLGRVGSIASSASKRAALASQTTSAILPLQGAATPAETSNAPPSAPQLPAAPEEDGGTNGKKRGPATGRGLDSVTVLRASLGGATGVAATPAGTATQSNSSRWIGASSLHSVNSETGGHAAQGSPPRQARPAGPSALLPTATDAAHGAGGAACAVVSAGGSLKKNGLNFLTHVVRDFVALYGPIIVLMENLHEFDAWSWQLLLKLVEGLPDKVLVLATTRPQHHQEGSRAPGVGGKQGAAKATALCSKLMKVPTTSRISLEPFNFAQTRALMKSVADNPYPDQYVLAVMEKTGGMPLYIEKVTEFLCQKPWLTGDGGTEFTANVNKMIRNLNFQQVIMERMDRLKPSVHLTLKVASVMGQWVDLDILHKFYPLAKSKEELHTHLMELEAGAFLKPTDTEGVWEFNMVERDIVYEVIPHYQRRRLHAKLARELEASLEEHHVATLTTIAYHWNQACVGHEVTEVECALKAIEFWARAADAGYCSSSLMEALRLYQKAGQIAELLSETVGPGTALSFAGNRALSSVLLNSAVSPVSATAGTGGNRGTSEGSGAAGSTRAASRGGASDDPSARARRTSQAGSDENDPEAGGRGNGSFSALGPELRGEMNWSLISDFSRAQWEKWKASCCLGILMQHQLEYSTQMELQASEDYFTMLMEHAVRGLMLLGTPAPADLMLVDEGPTGLARLLPCCAKPAELSISGRHEGVVLQDTEVSEIRDILLVMIVAADHASRQQDPAEYTRLLTFCQRVCTYFKGCTDAGTDPFADVEAACVSRIKVAKTARPKPAPQEFAFGVDDNAPEGFVDRSYSMGPSTSMVPSALSPLAQQQHSLM